MQIHILYESKVSIKPYQALTKTTRYALVNSLASPGGRWVSQVRVAVNRSAPPRDHIRRGEDCVGLHVLDVLHLTSTREKVNLTKLTTKSRVRAYGFRVSCVPFVIEYPILHRTERRLAERCAARTRSHALCLITLAAAAALRSPAHSTAALDLLPPVPLEDLLARRGLLCLAAGRALGAGGVARAAAARGSPRRSWRRSRCHWVLKCNLVSGCGTVHEARTAHRTRPTRRACRA